MEKNLKKIDILYVGSSLTIQWLGLGTFTAVALGSKPGQGAGILQAIRHSQKKKKKNIYISESLCCIPESNTTL